VGAAQNPEHSIEWADVQSMSWEEYAQWREASGLAARSAEGMTHASISMASRWYKRNQYGR
jgi:hypothetical protein